MKKLLSIITVAIICINFGCKGSDKLYTEAKFIKQAKKTAHCGHFAFAAVMEFKIISKDSSSKNIQIIVPCPELYGEDFFNFKDTYIIQLERGNNSETNYMLVDDPKHSSFHNKDLEWWAIDIKHK